MRLWRGREEGEGRGKRGKDGASALVLTWKIVSVAASNGCEKGERGGERDGETRLGWMRWNRQPVWGGNGDGGSS